MTTDLSAFRYEEKGACVVTACLEIVAFSGSRVLDGANGFANFYHAFVDAFGGQIKWYNTEDMKRMKPIDQKTLDMVPFWFSDATSMTAEALGMWMHSGTVQQDATPPSFEMYCDQGEDEPPNAFFRIVLPQARIIEQGSEKFLDLICRALDDFPLLSGYAGYGFFWQDLDPSISKKAARHFAPWMRRHPGFAYGDPFSLSHIALTGVLNVNWLTLLGAGYVQQLGGEVKLKKALSDPIRLHPLKGNGVIIQAGSEPQIGDVNRQDNLPLYRQVAQAIRPVWIPDEEAAEAWIEGLKPDEMEDWIGRFFK